MCNETGQPKTKNTSVIQLDEDGQRRFAELLANPPVPTEAMKALGALPNLEIRRGDVSGKNGPSMTC